jgi:hypothetical protein
MMEMTRRKMERMMSHLRVSLRVEGGGLVVEGRRGAASPVSVSVVTELES